MKTIVLRGSKKNALSTHVMERALAEIGDAGNAPLLVTGEGDTFSAGLDLKEIAGLDASGLETYLRLLDRLVTVLYRHPAPTVAWVNGHAIAGGCVVAACCDVRIATDDPKVKIGLNEVPLGLTFPPRILRLCRNRSPLAARSILEGTLHDPAGALAVGFVDEISPAAGPRAEEVLGRLAALPERAYTNTKRAIRAGVLDDDPTDEPAFAELLPVWAERIAVLRTALGLPAGPGR